MEQLYLQTNRLLHDIQTGLVQMESAPSPDMAQLAESEVQSTIDQAVSNCERLDTLVNKEPVSRRSKAKQQVNQLRYDCQHLQAGLRQLQHKRCQREEQDREREALLSQQFRPNGENTSIVIDQQLDHHNRLSTANRRMDDMLSSGVNVLTNLRDQRTTLKGAQRRMLDLLNTLGLSNTVMRLIERRSTQDKMIFFAAAGFSCLLMYFIWHYYGR